METTYVGSVKDEEGNPVPNATVGHTCGHECPGEKTTTQADEDGKYILTVPTPNTAGHEISSTKPGYSVESHTPDVGLQNQTVPVSQDFTLNHLPNDTIEVTTGDTSEVPLNNTAGEPSDSNSEEPANQ